MGESRCGHSLAQGQAGPGQVCLALGPHWAEDTGPLMDLLPIYAREQPSQHPEPGHGGLSMAAPNLVPDQRLGLQWPGRAGGALEPTGRSHLFLQAQCGGGGKRQS